MGGMNLLGDESLVVVVGEGGSLLGRKFSWCSWGGGERVGRLSDSQRGQGLPGLPISPSSNGESPAHHYWFFLMLYTIGANFLFF